MVLGKENLCISSFASDGIEMKCGMNFQVIYARDLARIQWEQRALVVDIRPKEWYEKGHWPEAVNYVEGEVDFTKVLNKKRLVIFYCQHGGGSMQMARKLGLKGFQTGTVVGGYETMKKFQKAIPKFNRMCFNKK